MPIDYLQWQSDLSLNDVFANTEAMSYPTLKDHDLIYLSSLNDEGGRSVLILKAQGSEQGGLCITPAPYSLRTRINEYGGKPFWLFGDQLVFSNDQDGCLYQQVIERGQASEPTRLTKEAPPRERFHYSEVSKVAPDIFLAVVEHHSADFDENQCFLATINCRIGSATPQRLSPQADFFSNLVINSKSSLCAWIQWNHPCMPWDATELWMAEIEHYDRATDSPRLNNIRKVNLPGSSSICQLLFAEDGLLYFVADYAGYLNDDAENFWNIGSIDLNNAEAEAQVVTGEKLEFGYPHWQYGDARLVQADKHELLAIGSAPERDFLFQIDTASRQTRVLDNELVYAQNLSSNGLGQVAMVAKYIDRPPAIVVIDTQKQACSERHRQSIEFGDADVSKPEHFSFVSGQNQQAHGFYYPPCNRKYASRDSLKPPPLLVMVHGGPTARAYGVFDLQKQYWTQRGFAIVDINHRGSNGYGRAFRDALYGQWGEDDCTDIIAGIDYLISQGLADAQRVCIRGKSAGGYSVLRALTTHPSRFSVGACYYGIGNLVTLAETTHKFEAHYTDRLIGEKYNADSAQDQRSLFQQRSPINQIQNLQSAMIVFQGALDKVVPPAVAHEVIKALQKQNIAHKYVEYADEAHGFRQVANNIDSWQLELDFYLQHL